MGYEYRKFNKPATICRKNTTVGPAKEGEGRGRVLELDMLTQDRFLSLKHKDYEEDHFGTLSPVRYDIDVRFGTRDG
jgi:hypothetical protein